MICWVCPACKSDFEPAGHDLARCRWQHEVDMRVFEYAMLRTANEMASPPQKAELAKLVRAAEDGNAGAMESLQRFVLKLVWGKDGADER